MHPRRRYANSYMASSRFVYLPSITFKYFLETFETYKCLACCSLSGRSDFVEYLTDSVPVRNSFLHLQTVLNIIKSLIRPIRPNLPLSSVNICITEFCANFYKSFSFFTILNPFHNNSVQPRWAKKAVSTLTFTASWPLSNLSVKWNRAETKHFK